MGQTDAREPALARTVAPPAGVTAVEAPSPGRGPAPDAMSPSAVLALQHRAGNASVQRVLHPGAQGLIVGDSEATRPGQLAQSAFLGRLREAVTATASALLGPDWSPADCPQIAAMFSHYAALDPAACERIMRRGSGLAAPASALDYVAPICARISGPIVRWGGGEDLTWEVGASGLPGALEEGGAQPGDDRAATPAGDELIARQLADVIERRASGRSLQRGERPAPARQPPQQAPAPPVPAPAPAVVPAPVPVVPAVAVPAPRALELLYELEDIDDEDEDRSKKFAFNHFVKELLTKGQKVGVTAQTLPSQDEDDAITAITRAMGAGGGSYGERCKEAVPDAVRKANQAGYDIRNAEVRDGLRNVVTAGEGRFGTQMGQFKGEWRGGGFK
jgi:hypothetical protein